MEKEPIDMARIEAKLDTVIRLLALSVASDNHSLKDRAVRLQRAGLTPKDIASICDTTPNTVSVALSTAKRVGKKRAKKQK
jgi:DNA-binding CsgD family transcriptional regulator